MELAVNCVSIQTYNTCLAFISRRSPSVKNIVLTGFGNITLLDLDTIDLSNLNRQFLFRKKDVKQSKALVSARQQAILTLPTTPSQVAAQTAAPFNPNVKLIPIHGNIKEPQYDIQWFQQFDIVLNALDNLGEPPQPHPSFRVFMNGRRSEAREQDVYGCAGPAGRIWDSGISWSSPALGQSAR